MALGIRYWYAHSISKGIKNDILSNELWQAQWPPKDVHALNFGTCQYALTWQKELFGCN